MAVSEEELEKRGRNNLATTLYSRGVLGKYAHIVSSASRGAVTDFWNMDKSGKNKLILFENQIQTTSTSPAVGMVTDFVSSIHNLKTLFWSNLRLVSLVCSLIFIEYQKQAIFGLLLLSSKVICLINEVAVQGRYGRSD